jgi:hypothetical protein
MVDDIMAGAHARDRSHGRQEVRDIQKLCLFLLHFNLSGTNWDALRAALTLLKAVT